MKSLIIYDWDDTLFPTTWFCNQFKSLESCFYKKIILPDLSFDQKNVFKTIDSNISYILSKSIEIGKVFIISYANLDWLISLLNYLPNTKSIINDNVEVISISDRYSDLINDEIKRNIKYATEHGLTQHKFKFKYATTNHKRTFYDDIVANLILNDNYDNIINIGDGFNEHDALKYIITNKKYNFDGKVFKSLKMQYHPLISYFINEQFTLAEMLPDVVKMSSNYFFYFDDVEKLNDGDKYLY